MKVQSSVYVIYVLVSTLSILVKSQYIDPSICVNKCLCLQSEALVSCHENDKVRALPTNIDKSMTRFIIQKGSFDSPKLYRHNLTGLEHLTFLKIIYYNLNYIGARTFINMNKLQYLDLSHNKLITIASLAFCGLALLELHVMENVNIKFHTNAFYNMSALTINMRSNNLSILNYDLFKGTKVKNFFLYNNRITTIDPKFQFLFHDSESLLDVSNNPLICDCSLSWLAQFLSLRYSLRKSTIQAKKINISCARPEELMNKELMFLTADELKCSPLRIKTIKLHFDTDIPQLTCVSRIGGTKPPTVTWLHYVDDYEKNIVKGSHFVEYSQGDYLQTLSISYNTINLTKTFFKNGFSRLICIASAKDDLVQRLEIHIRKFNRPLVTLPSNQTYQMTAISTETSFLFVRHFSILEMLGAILGTFSLTFIGLIFLLRYLKSYQDRIMDKNDFVDMHRSINSIKPYLYVPHGNSSTYSMPNSHTEYESPTKLDNVQDVSNMYASYPSGRTAYLDFKTHNLIVT